jgi:uncharacterized protein YecT (DUF1311 family)
MRSIRIHLVASLLCAALAPTVIWSAELDDTFSDQRARDAFLAEDDKFCSEAARGEIELGSCLSAQAEFEEKRLNDTYQTLLAALPEDRKTLLEAEEMKWIEERDAECARQVEDARLCRNGCGVPWTMRLNCMKRQARSRTHELIRRWQR